MSKRGGWGPTGFGGRLKALREAAGLSQQQLAHRAGCNKFTVAKLEAGKQEPAWPFVLAFCAALGVACQSFVNDASASGVGHPTGEEGPADVRPKEPPGRPRKKPPTEGATPQGQQGADAPAKPARRRKGG